MSKIKKLEIKNYLGIREFELKPGKINIIKGKNEKGKTTVIHSIEKLFSNNDRRDDNRVNIINQDGNKAELFIELDDGRAIQRNITEKNDYLTYKKDGFNQKAPQTKLNQLISEFAFNPVDFIMEDPDKQAEIMLNCLDIEVTEEDVKEWLGEDVTLPEIDFEQHGLKVIDDLYSAFYEKRRDKNAEQKNINSEYCNEINKIPEGFQPEEHRGITLKEKYQKLQKIQDKNKKIKKTENLIQDWNNEIDIKKSKKETVKIKANNKIEKKQEEIERLKREIKQLETNKQKDIKEIDEEIKGIKEQQQKARKFLENNEVQDTEELEEEIEQFEENKDLLNTYDLAQEKKEEYEKAFTEWEQLDEIVKKLDEKPQELVEQADLPVEGLTIKDNVVYIKGRPIRNLSTEEKISLSVEIARETAKEIKLICIDRFESLDPDNQEILLKEMQQDDFQYFVTQVSGDKEMKVETITEDGTKVDPETGEVICPSIKTGENVEVEDPF